MLCITASMHDFRAGGPNSCSYAHVARIFNAILKAIPEQIGGVVLEEIAVQIVDGISWRFSEKETEKNF